MSYNSITRKAQAEETRQNILQNAITLFSTNDFNSVSVDSIVKSAGVAKGSFYVHFASKEALVAEILLTYVSKLDIEYETYLNSLQATTKYYDKIVLLTAKIAEILTDKIGYSNLKTVYKVLLNDSINKDVMVGYNRKLYNIYKHLFESGMQTGEFTNTTSSDTLSKYTIAAIRGITYEWCVRGTTYDYKQECTNITKIILQGISK